MMSTVTRTPAEIARSGATPEFAALCETLYGSAIDPDEVWDTVIKASPDQADVNATSRKRKVLEGIALGSTVAGGVLGAKEGLAGAREVRTARKAGQLIPKKAYGSLALAGLATGGDAITTGVLASDKKKQPVGKSGALVPLEAMKNGHLAHAEVVRSHVVSDLGHIPATSHTASAPLQDSGYRPAQARSLSYRAGKLSARTLKTPEGRAGLAAGSVAGAGASSSMRRRGSGDGYGDYVGKADDSVVFKGVFSEIDEDQRTAFGWASVTEIGGQPVVDRQGDYITTEDIEKAAYDYVHKSRVGGDMHRRAVGPNGEAAHKVSDMIESVVFTDEKIAKMGLPEDFPRGWWVGFKIHDDETWGLVKKGERTGFSIHGKGIRKDLELDTLMGYQ